MKLFWKQKCIKLEMLLQKIVQLIVIEPRLTQTDNWCLSTCCIKPRKRYPPILQSSLLHTYLI